MARKPKIPPQKSALLDFNSSLRSIAYWNSTLFSEVYIRNDLKRDFSDQWEKDYGDQIFDHNGDTVKSGFYHFYNEFRNIAPSLRDLAKNNISETDTITKIIAPVLDALGWYDNCKNNVDEPYAAETSFTLSEGGKKKTYRTDMILVNWPQEAGFIRDERDSEKRKREAREYCVAPLEAKYWNRILDKEKAEKKEDKGRADTKSDDSSQTLSFNEQLLNYMTILNRKWGIVTDGNVWRLLNYDLSKESPERCFEFRLESLLSQESIIESEGGHDEEFLENAKYFYLFFGKHAFIKNETGKVFLDEVLKESRKYIDNIEEDLKDRFISAMNIMCNGLLQSLRMHKNKEINVEDLKMIRSVAESHLFNILFIKSCESRGILPIKAPKYYQISLTGIIDRISVFDPEKYISDRDKEYMNRRLSNSLSIYKYKPEGYALYKNLINLTEVIHDGARTNKFGFEIEGFKESIFSAQEWRFAEEHRLTDSQMIRVLFELGYSKSRLAHQRSYQQIPYNYFTPRQLGSIYESLLEYKLEIAKKPMVFVKRGKYKQWVKLSASLKRRLKGQEPLAEPGEAFLSPNNSKRKETGSYYTPHRVVQYIVKSTIGKRCRRLTSEEILSLKVVDAAMGSGHFLNAAVGVLAELYMRAMEDEVQLDEVPTLKEAKRAVLNRCIFGVDINAGAVKLAKMSLWLESAQWGRKLERLDGQLIHGDALLPDTRWNDFGGIREEAFDFVLGNPPYLRSSSIPADKRGVYRDLYESATGAYDVFVPFCELALKLLKQKGVYGQIISNKICVADYAKIIRRKLVEETSIKKMIDFTKASKVFNDAAVVPVIIIGELGAPRGEKLVEYGTPIEEEVGDMAVPPKI